MTFSIKIFDTAGNLIGELPTASVMHITKYIEKGFIVKDLYTGQQITLDDLNNMIGASDGFIDMGDI